MGVGDLSGKGSLGLRWTQQPEAQRDRLGPKEEAQEAPVKGLGVVSPRIPEAVGCHAGHPEVGVCNQVGPE